MNSIFIFIKYLSFWYSKASKKNWDFGIILVSVFTWLFLLLLLGLDIPRFLVTWLSMTAWAHMKLIQQNGQMLNWIVLNLIVFFPNRILKMIFFSHVDRTEQVSNSCSIELPMQMIRVTRDWVCMCWPLLFIQRLIQYWRGLSQE